MRSWQEYRPFEESSNKVIGPLESEIMDVMWERGTETARGVYDAIRESKPVRRSTVSILLGRLCERNLVKKKVEKGRGGERFVYTVTMTKDEFTKDIVSTVIDSLMDSFPDHTISYISKLSDQRG